MKAEPQIVSPSPRPTDLDVWPGRAPLVQEPRVITPLQSAQLAEADGAPAVSLTAGSTGECLRGLPEVGGPR